MVLAAAAIIVLLGLAVVARVFTASLFGDGGSGSGGKGGNVAFAVGGCVRVTAQPSVIRSIPDGPVLRAPARYAAVECDDKAAYAKIAKMADAPLTGLGDDAAKVQAAGCGEDTDEIATVKSTIGATSQTACLRKLKGPHPGDPGQGGGLARTGDCVQVFNTYTDNVRESACTTKDWTVGNASFGKEWFGQIVAKADTARGCRAPAVFTITTRNRPHPVLCIAKNGGWLPAAGDCVDANLFGRSYARRPCTQRGLAIKITALVPPGRACPGGRTPRAVPGYIPRVCMTPVY